MSPEISLLVHESLALLSNWTVQKNQNFGSGMNLMNNLVWPIYFIVEEIET